MSKWSKICIRIWGSHRFLTFNIPLPAPSWLWCYRCRISSPAWCRARGRRLAVCPLPSSWRAEEPLPAVSHPASCPACPGCCRVEEEWGLASSFCPGPRPTCRPTAAWWPLPTGSSRHSSADPSSHTQESILPAATSLACLDPTRATCCSSQEQERPPFQPLCQPPCLPDISTLPPRPVWRTSTFMEEKTILGCWHSRGQASSLLPPTRYTSRPSTPSHLTTPPRPPTYTFKLTRGTFTITTTTTTITIITSTNSNNRDPTLAETGRATRTTTTEAGRWEEAGGGEEVPLPLGSWLDLLLLSSWRLGRRCLTPTRASYSTCWPCSPTPHYTQSSPLTMSTRPRTTKLCSVWRRG